jgi:flagellar hook-associated protein 3 FlgL
MRITDSAIITDFLSSINRSRSRINKLNTQLSTQKRIQRVSDDPSASGSILRLNEDLERVTAYKGNVVDGKNFLKVTADSLGQVSDLLGEVKNILTGAVSSGDQSLLGKLADQVDQFLSLGLEVANTQYDRKYVFGGTQTTTPPFVRTGTPTQVTYQGDARSIQYQVGDAVSQVVNISGAAAFASTGQIDLNGVLDRNAAINTVVTQTMQITDGTGVAHNVVLSMRKTDANTWALSAALPPGTTDASLTGGTATVTFDPVTGQMKDMVRGSALVLSPAGVTPGQTAPPINMIYSSGGVTEGIPGGGVSTLGGTQRNVSVFNKMMEISRNLRNGIKPTAEDMTMLSMMQDVVMREEAKAGAYASNLGTANDYLTVQNEHLLDLLSAKQDIDLPEIAMKLKQEQLMLDAALSAAANIIPKSLLNFLK